MVQNVLNLSVKCFISRTFSLIIAITYFKKALSQTNGKKDYWWDGTHTTATGSKAIVEIIFPDIKNIVN